MCGRFALRVNRQEIQLLRGYDVDIPEWRDEDDFQPRYNIAPRTNVPVIRRRDPQVDGILAATTSTSTSAPDSTDADTAPTPNANSKDTNASGVSAQAGVVTDAVQPQPQSRSQPSLIMQTMKWGLVPSWSKTENLSLNTINARSENIIDGSGMWGGIRGKKRCAIPCQGYYEWLTKEKDLKLPFFTKRKDGHLLLMAGLYDTAYIDGKTLWTFSIVTTEANPQFYWLHERQPVFLTTHDALQKWLDTSSGQWSIDLTKLVQPYSNTRVALECYPVPIEVGKVGKESPTFIEPIKKRKDGIEVLFMRQQQQASSSSLSSPAPNSPTKPTASSSDSPSTPFPPPPQRPQTPPNERDASFPKHEPKTPTMPKSASTAKSPQKRTAPSSPSTPTPHKRVRIQQELDEGEEKKVEEDESNPKSTSTSNHTRTKSGPPTTPKKPSSSTSTPRKLPPTPASSRRNKKGKETPPGNTKIDSFFKKASES